MAFHAAFPLLVCASDFETARREKSAGITAAEIASVALQAKPRPDGQHKGLCQEITGMPPSTSNGLRNYSFNFSPP